MITRVSFILSWRGLRGQPGKACKLWQTGENSLLNQWKGSACLGACFITPLSQLPGHSSMETACRPIHLTVPHCRRATQLASCHRHRQHSQAACRASSPPHCYAFSLQKTMQKIRKWAGDWLSLAGGFLFSPRIWQHNSCMDIPSGKKSSW